MTPPTLSSKFRPLPLTLDSREFKRFRVRVPGRCMFPNKSEHDCSTINMSAGGAALWCDTLPEKGDTVVIYLEFIGRVVGKVTRSSHNSFAIAFEASKLKRVKLEQQLMWLQGQDVSRLTDERKFERILPTDPRATLNFEGVNRSVKIIDISTRGAAIEADEIIPLGETVVLGADVKGKVTRSFRGGFAIEFLLPLPFASFDESITFRAEDAE